MDGGSSVASADSAHAATHPREAAGKKLDKSEKVSEDISGFEI